MLRNAQENLSSAYVWARRGRIPSQKRLPKRMDSYPQLDSGESTRISWLSRKPWARDLRDKKINHFDSVQISDNGVGHWAHTTIKTMVTLTSGSPCLVGNILQNFLVLDFLPANGKSCISCVSSWCTTVNFASSSLWGQSTLHVYRLESPPPTLRWNYSGPKMSKEKEVLVDRTTPAYARRGWPQQWRSRLRNLPETWWSVSPRFPGLLENADSAERTQNNFHAVLSHCRKTGTRKTCLCDSCADLHCTVVKFNFRFLENFSHKICEL